MAKSNYWRWFVEADLMLAPQKGASNSAQNSVLGVEGGRRGVRNGGGPSGAHCRAEQGHRSGCAPSTVHVCRKIDCRTRGVEAPDVQVERTGLGVRSTWAVGHSSAQFLGRSGAMARRGPSSACRGECHDLCTEATILLLAWQALRTRIR